MFRHRRFSHVVQRIPGLRPIHSLPNSTKDVVVTPRHPAGGGIQVFKATAKVRCHMHPVSLLSHLHCATTMQTTDAKAHSKTLLKVVGGVASVGALLLYMSTTSREFAEGQAVLRTAQELRSLRKSSESSDDRVVKEVRQVNAGLLTVECHIVTPSSGAADSAPVVALSAPSGE